MIAALAVMVAFAPSYQIESMRVRFTHFDQNGRGYQSAAGGEGQPGSERATIEQPQAEVVARIGDRLTERIWVPVDVVTAASPDHTRFGRAADAPAPDAITSPSRGNLAGSVDSLSTYHLDRTTDVSFRGAFHVEEPFESWAFGLGVTRAMAEDNTVLDASVHQIVDWFDRFGLDGERYGRANRSTTNANLTLTQLLSATTIVGVSYGGTLQLGTLGNTWQSVLLSDDMRGTERLPWDRQRHALSTRLAQWLPWQGAIKLHHRAYIDNWGLGAHTVEADLHQRLRPWLTVRASYRWHRQSAARYFAKRTDPAEDGFRTADSDLAGLVAQTVGGALALDLPYVARGRDLHIDIGYEHYFRSNHLAVDVTTCGLGFRF